MVRREVVYCGKHIFKIKKNECKKLNSDLLSYFKNEGKFSSNKRDDPLLYWSKCSTSESTTDIVKCYLSVDGSTACVERGFSQLKLMQGLNRHLLKVETLESMLRYKVYEQQLNVEKKTNTNDDQSGINSASILEEAMREIDGCENSDLPVDESFLNRVMLMETNIAEQNDNDRSLFEFYYDLEDDSQHISDYEDSEDEDYALADIDSIFGDNTL